MRRATVASVALALLLADCATKRAAVQYLQPERTPHDVVGTTVRFTLGFNRQAVMGLPAGPYARWVLVVAMIVGIAILVRLLRDTRPGERARAIGLALLLGGAAGNLVSRLISSRGVVDFIDIGVGTWRFWTFNVADIGISTGAALLVWALWRAAPAQPGTGHAP